MSAQDQHGGGEGADGWKRWRPAIWLAMVGVAVMLVFSSFWLGVVFIGAAIGAAIRIEQRRRRARR
jgi:hypothetical protein